MLLFSDSFDYYTTLSQKYESTGGTESIQSSVVRNGIQALKINAASGGYVRKAIANTATIFVGFAWFSVTPNGAFATIWAFQDAGTVQVDLRIDSSNFLYFTRNGTQIGSKTASPISLGAWHYLEAKITVDPTVGVAILRLDGSTTPVLNNTGANTRATANSYGNQVLWGFAGGAGYASPAYIDDVYVIDTTGTANNDFLGDVTVTALVPNGNGSVNNFSIGGTSPAATNWQSVREIPPDDGVTLVSSSSIGAIDRYTYPAAVPTPGTPFAVVAWPRVAKDVSGARTVRVSVKSGGTTSDNGTDFSLSQSYQTFMALFETDPNTSAQWTLPNIAAAEFGVKVTG